tara:strand:- start:2382 stop:2918 length:537 start_codon:yes stop_codon:yes gene_type:complete
MDFVREQLSNIDNHHYLTIVFGKKGDNQFEANIGKNELTDKYNHFLKNSHIEKNNISKMVYRDYLNNGITYRYTDEGVSCFVEETIEDLFTDFNGHDSYLFLNKKEEHPINYFPIDKEMDDIKDKSEIIINIDNLFNLVFHSYNEKVYYFKIVILKYNIYSDKLIQKLEETLALLLFK